MANPKIVAYLKTSCGWSMGVRATFKKYGLAYEDRDIINNADSYQEMVDKGFDPQVVRQVISAVDRNEYKRRQAPPGVKITPRAFGKDRRLPIVNRYRQP